VTWLLLMVNSAYSSLAYLCPCPTDSRRTYSFVRVRHSRTRPVLLRPWRQNRNVLTGCVYSDFAADSDARRSVTRYIMFLNGDPINWQSCRQGGVMLSSSEAEYVVVSAVTSQAPGPYITIPQYRFDKTKQHPGNC